MEKSCSRTKASHKGVQIVLPCGVRSLSQTLVNRMNNDFGSGWASKASKKIKRKGSSKPVARCKVIFFPAGRKTKGVTVGPKPSLFCLDRKRRKRALPAALRKFKFPKGKKVTAAMLRKRGICRHSGGKLVGKFKRC